MSRTSSCDRRRRARPAPWRPRPPPWSSTSSTKPNATPRSTRSRRSCSRSWRPSRTCAPVSSTIAASGNWRSASWAATARRSTPNRARSRRRWRRPGSSGPSPSNAALDRPEMRSSRPTLTRLAELGISTATLSETLRVATIGDIDENLAKFNVGDRQIPIRVQLNEAARDDLRVMERCRCRTPAGGARAALLGGQNPFRPGAVLDQPLRPRAPRGDRRRPGARRRLGQATRDRLRLCRR